jgi:hypothetical protein
LFLIHLHSCFHFGRDLRSDRAAAPEQCIEVAAFEYEQLTVRQGDDVSPSGLMEHQRHLTEEIAGVEHNPLIGPEHLH